jgi:hypothetical protein
MRTIRNSFSSLAIIGGLITSLNFVNAQIWLVPTGVSNGLACLNLHNATNQVYAIWSTTNLLANWNVETEVWSTNPAVLPFTVPTLERQNLFMQAEDWTGVTENGNTTPDWWFWEYFGTLALSDTHLDSQGNTLLYDYQNGLDPNIISFSIGATNNYVSTSYPTVPLNITGGVPSYLAVLVNETNLANASWQPFTSPNVVVPLNSGNGNYIVWVGLRGLPSDAQQTWQGMQLTLNTIPLTLTITNPAVNMTSQPVIQLQGYANKPLSSLAFDVSNAAGIWTNQTGYIIGQCYDTNLSEFTTNYFQCYDILLTNGLNAIILHATDLAGNTVMTNFSITLDCTGDTTPPVLTMVWPQDGTYISGSTFTLEAQVDDPTVTVTASIVDASGDANTIQGQVERSGKVWVQNLPVAAGENTLTITATDAAGNAAVANMTLYQSSVTVTLDPLSSDQFNQTSVSVSGTVSDSNCEVWVNGVQAMVYDGFWWADNVPVSATGTAVFDVEVYSGSSSNVAAYVKTNPIFCANDSQDNTATVPNW